MKFIGQYIQSFIARFRNDVYLEDVSTGTIASGGNLGLDSNNKIVKATEATGDLTSIVAGTGLSGTSLTGPIPTLNVDASLSHVTTLAGLTSLGAAGATTDIAAGDLTMFNPVNHGNHTISVGKDANDRFSIETVYNRGAQTIDYVNFQTYTTSSGSNDGRYSFLVDEVELVKILDNGLYAFGNLQSKDDDATAAVIDTTASSATQGGKIRLVSDDNAVMGDNHRLGVIQFEGAEDAGSGAGSNTHSIGARIQAICRDAWDGSNNDADLEFYTTDGTTESKVLTLDADKLATFAGAVTVTGALTGTLATSSQPNITRVGTIASGVWQGTAIATAYIAGDAINGDKIADDAVDSEHYTDGSIDTAHIADDQVTFAKAVGVTPNIYGSIIKVLPSDFMANEEPGVTKTLQFVDNSSSGIKPGDNDTELLAFVSIPETMKATHVDVYADDTLAFSVYEFNIHESVGDLAGASKGTGNCNTTLDITDVNATATNYLLIQVITVSKADRVFGAKVTIATQ